MEGVEGGGKGFNRLTDFGYGGAVDVGIVFPAMMMAYGDNFQLPDTA